MYQEELMDTNFISAMNTFIQTIFKQLEEVSFEDVLSTLL